MNLNTPITDIFPLSLLEYAKQVLGVEFSRLPVRMQTGYINVLWNHHNLIKSNTHSQDTDSFFMDAHEVESYFTDLRNFRAINNNGYFLIPKRTRHGIIEGRYNFSRKTGLDATYCNPTNWIVKTIKSAQGFKSYKEGYSNGFQLSPMFSQLFVDWKNNQILNTNTQLDMINRKGERVKDIVEKIGGAIYRTKSAIRQTININADVKLNYESLAKHKNLLLDLQVRLKGLNESEFNHEVRLIKDDEKHKGFMSSQLFDHLSIIQSINETNRLLINVKGEDRPSISIFYEESSTGRYMAKNGMLQNYHRNVREAAFKGCYEYSVEMLFPNILNHFTQTDDLLNSVVDRVVNYRGPSWGYFDVVEEDEREELGVYEYFEDLIRPFKELWDGQYFSISTITTFAEELDSDFDTINQAILVLSYGGQLSGNCRTLIFKVCNSDVALVNRIINHHIIGSYAIFADFCCNFGSLDSIDTGSGNAVGIISMIKNNSKVLAHLLQGYERQIMDVIIEHSKQKDIALLLHDSIIFYNKQSIEKLSVIVKKEIGFDLTFSERKY